jgi:hypothetical protein
VIELGLLDREQEHGPLPQLERDRALLLERAVPGESLGEELADPGRRLAEEEAAVAARRPCADAAAVDDEDALARLGEDTCSRAASDAGPDDDGVGPG